MEDLAVKSENLISIDLPGDFLENPIDYSSNSNDQHLFLFENGVQALEVKNDANPNRRQLFHLLTSSFQASGSTSAINESARAVIYAPSHAKYKDRAKNAIACDDDDVTGMTRANLQFAQQMDKTLDNPLEKSGRPPRCESAAWSPALSKSSGHFVALLTRSNQLLVYRVRMTTKASDWLQVADLASEFRQRVYPRHIFPHRLRNLHSFVRRAKHGNEEEEGGEKDGAPFFYRPTHHRQQQQKQSHKKRKLSKSDSTDAFIKIENATPIAQSKNTNEIDESGNELEEVEENDVTIRCKSLSEMRMVLSDLCISKFSWSSKIWSGSESQPYYVIATLSKSQIVTLWAISADSSTNQSSTTQPIKAEKKTFPEQWMSSSDSSRVQLLLADYTALTRNDVAQHDDDDDGGDKKVEDVTNHHSEVVQIKVCDISPNHIMLILVHLSGCVSALFYRIEFVIAPPRDAISSDSHHHPISMCVAALQLHCQRIYAPPRSLSSAAHAATPGGSIRPILLYDATAGGAAAPPAMHHTLIHWSDESRLLLLAFSKYLLPIFFFQSDDEAAPIKTTTTSRGFSSSSCSRLVESSRLLPIPAHPHDRHQLPISGCVTGLDVLDNVAFLCCSSIWNVRIITCTLRNRAAVSASGDADDVTFGSYAVESALRDAFSVTQSNAKNSTTNQFSLSSLCVSSCGAFVSFLCRRATSLWGPQYRLLIEPPPLSHAHSHAQTHSNGSGAKFVMLRLLDEKHLVRLFLDPLRPFRTKRDVIMAMRHLYNSASGGSGAMTQDLLHKVMDKVLLADDTADGDGDGEGEERERHGGGGEAATKLFELQRLRNALLVFGFNPNHFRKIAAFRNTTEDARRMMELESRIVFQAMLLRLSSFIAAQHAILTHCLHAFYICAVLKTSSLLVIANSDSEATLNTSSNVAQLLDRVERRVWRVLRNRAVANEGDENKADEQQEEESNDTEEKLEKDGQEEEDDEEEEQRVKMREIVQRLSFCLICKKRSADAPNEALRYFTCESGHRIARCCQTLLPIKDFDHRICDLCGAIAVGANQNCAEFGARETLANEEEREKQVGVAENAGGEGGSSEWQCELKNEFCTLCDGNLMLVRNFKEKSVRIA